MPITKFKITTAPPLTSLKVNAFPVVINQEYTMAQQSFLTAEFVGAGVPYDIFGFKLGNDDNSWSPEYFCTINVNVNSGAITIDDTTVFISLNRTTDVSSAIVFDDNTDRIMFTINPNPSYGKLRINGIDMQLNKEYFLHQYINVEFISDYTGLLQNVSHDISFKAGNKDGFSTNHVLSLVSTSNMKALIGSGSTITLANLTPQ